MALAFSIGSFLSLLALYVVMRNRLPEFAQAENKLGLFFRNLFIAGLALVVIVQLEKMIVGNLVNMDKFWGVLVQTSGAIVIGAGGYLVILQFLRVPEVELIKRFLLVRFLRLSGNQIKKSSFELEDVSERHN